MNFVLYDEDLHWKNLLPLTFTRPISELRIGILTIKEKWEKWLNTSCSYHSQAYLSEKFKYLDTNDSTFIFSTYLPDLNLVNAVSSLNKGEALIYKSKLIAFRGAIEEITKSSLHKKVEYHDEILEINYVWDLFQKNDSALRSDFNLLSNNRTSQEISETVRIIGDKSNVFFEKGAKAEACILNAETGPIYLGADSEIMEGSIVRGPFALGEHSALKLGTKIYGATTIGPHSKVGGEVNNSIILGYSNKAHDGFLGNSVIGEWCNLGADTNNSNLKNNYGNVKLYNYAKNAQIDTGLQFCGLIMGDYSKSGINTMFNTGTVVGVGSNIFGGGFPKTTIPNFSWGGSEGFESYQLNKLVETSEKVYERRGLKFGDTERKILESIKKFYSLF